MEKVILTNEQHETIQTASAILTGRLGPSKRIDANNWMIEIHEETLERLEEARIDPSETYADIIMRICEFIAVKHSTIH